jgi:FAD:protein FMN transferase
VQVTLKKHEEPKRTYRPYVVVWIEDAQNRVVRTLALWGEDPRYQRKLGTWMRRMEDTEAPYMVGRATRAPGAYSVAWNGTDNFGRRVPAGNYTVRLELCREDGPHVVTAAKVACGREPYGATLAETAESNASAISYGPPKS